MVVIVKSADSSMPTVHYDSTEQTKTGFLEIIVVSYVCSLLRDNRQEQKMKQTQFQNQMQ